MYIEDLEKPFRFFAMPQSGDIIHINTKDYLVLSLIYQAQEKSTAQPVFYEAARLFLKEITSSEEFNSLLYDKIDTRWPL